MAGEAPRQVTDFAHFYTRQTAILSPKTRPQTGRPFGGAKPFGSHVIRASQPVREKLFAHRRYLAYHDRVKSFLRRVEL